MTSVCATSDGFATCGFDDGVQFVVKGAYTSTVVDVEGQPLGLQLFRFNGRDRVVVSLRTAHIKV